MPLCIHLGVHPISTISYKSVGQILVDDVVEATDELFRFGKSRGRGQTGCHKPGILRNFSEHGKLMDSENSVQPQGKIVANKVFLVCHSNICVKQLLLTG